MRFLSEVRHYLGNYHVKSGVYHYFRSEFNQAIGFLRKALDSDSLSAGDRDNARCYLTLSLVGLGERLAEKGEVAEGVVELQRAIEINPTYPDIHFSLAGMLERIDRLEEAVAAYRKAIECHPGYLEAHVGLAHCLVAIGDPEPAAEVFREALALKLRRIEEPFRRGIEKLESAEVDAALESFHEVFLAVRRLSDEHLRKALDRMRAEEYEKALEELDRALEASPKFPDLHNYRGIALCELERFDEAVDAFRRSSDLCPAHKVPRLNMAFTFLRAERNEDAEAELESILETHPEDPVALAGLEGLRSAKLAEKRGQGVRP